MLYSVIEYLYVDYTAKQLKFQKCKYKSPCKHDPCDKRRVAVRKSCFPQRTAAITCTWLKYTDIGNKIYGILVGLMVGVSEV